jgi:hypothetical protein
VIDAARDEGRVQEDIRSAVEALLLRPID